VTYAITCRTSILLTESDIAGDLRPAICMLLLPNMRINMQHVNMQMRVFIDGALAPSNATLHLAARDNE